MWWSGVHKCFRHIVCSSILDDSMGKTTEMFHWQPSRWIHLQWMPEGRHSDVLWIFQVSEVDVTAIWTWQSHITINNESHCRNSLTIWQLQDGCPQTGSSWIDISFFHLFKPNQKILVHPTLVITSAHSWHIYRVMLSNSRKTLQVGVNCAANFSDYSTDAPDCKYLLNSSDNVFSIYFLYLEFQK